MSTMALDELPIMTRCCCCISLETGAIITSILDMFLPQLVICFKILVLTMNNNLTVNFYEWRQEMKITVIDIVMASIGPFLGIILLISVLKKNHHYLLSYLFISLLVCLVYFIDAGLDAFAHPEMSLIRLIGIGFNVYLWLAMQSLYQYYKSLDPDYMYLLG